LGSIEANNLVKEFDGLRAVDKVTFEVNQGEIFGFLGPNGAGKTTTVRMITGVLMPDSGRAYIDGVDVTTDPISAKERIGIAPEEANCYIDLTARGNMHLAGELYSVPKKKIKEKSEELLNQFGLADRVDSKVKGFSKGMKQRLILAMALVNDPPILFLDEPTAGLDVASQRLIKERIRKLNKQGKTVFLTTHNISEADKLCDRVAIINKGQIATIDSPEKLKSTIQSTQSALVSFSGNGLSQDKLDCLKELKTVEEIEKEGDKYRLYGSDPGEIVEEVVDFARNENLKIISLNTSGPSLEEVFTHLTTS